LSKGYSVMYGYVRSRQLEGTFNNDPSIGCWPITALRIERGWGNPGEERWPYDDGSWPPKEPAHVDQYAKEKRIFAYQRIRSVTECREALFLQKSYILLSVDMTKGWRKTLNGQIPLPQKEDKIIAAHAFLVVGYDDNFKNLKFVNSWGADWGDNGYGYLPYDYFNRYLSEAWVDIRPKQIDINKYTYSSKAIGGVKMEWRLPSVLHDFIYGVEIRDSKSDDRKAWGFAFQYDDYLNVEELFVKPKYRERGYCKQLISSFERISKQLSSPLRFWISHLDSNAPNIETILHIADKYGYCLSDSGVQWADYKIESTKVPSQSKPYLDIHTLSTPKAIRPSARHNESDPLTHISLYVE